MNGILSFLSSINFQYPWFLILLFFIPYLAYKHKGKKQDKGKSIHITTTHFFKPAVSWKQRVAARFFSMRMLALALLIIALSGPRLKYKETITEGDGIDIVLCIDISGSMTEQDFIPSRLEAAKNVASEFVMNRPGDRIGVVIFSSQSFTLCPITTDHATVLSQIQSISNNSLPVDGTAIGSGLATSVDRLRSSKAKSKIIILLTDGVDFGGFIPPDKAMEMAKLFNIKVYTIGIGSEKEMDVTVPDASGAMTTQRQKLQFNQGLLQKVANATGGQYFYASDNNKLEKIYGNINKLEKSKIKTNTYNLYTEEFQPFLILGIVLLMLELFLRLSIVRKFP